MSQGKFTTRRIPREYLEALSGLFPFERSVLIGYSDLEARSAIGTQRLLGRLHSSISMTGLVLRPESTLPFHPSGSIQMRNKFPAKATPPLTLDVARSLPRQSRTSPYNK
jgi:hypothetical protein